MNPGRAARSEAWKAWISSSRCKVNATSSSPFSSPSRRRGSISNVWRWPDGETMVWASRSIETLPAPCVASISAASESTTALSTTMGKIPFWKQLAKKMSPKPEPMMARMPISCSDHTAPSRDEPQPKFGPVTNISAWR